MATKRKSKYGGARGPYLRARVKEELKRRVERFCHDREWTEGMVVREAVKEMLDREPT